MTVDPFTKLSPRQRDCLRLVADLKDSQQIGYELGISPRTVDSYLRDAVQLLGAHNRRHAATLLRAHEDATPEKLPGHFPRLEAEGAAERAFEVQFRGGASEEPTINAVREVPRAFACDGEPMQRPSRLPLLGGALRPGDLKPGMRLALIIGTSLASGFGFFILALAAVGLIAVAGNPRP